MRRRRSNSETNFWAGYADCMLAFFMVTLLMWILSSGITAFSDRHRAATLAQLEEQLRKAEYQIAKLKEENEELKTLPKEQGPSQLRRALEKIKQLERELLLAQIESDRLREENRKLTTELNDKPPIINLDDEATKSVNFETGSAVIRYNFAQLLKTEVFPNMLIILNRYSSIDTLEFVGHTDGAAVSQRGNFDEVLPRFLSGSEDIDQLNAGSNVDLGLLRALAVKNAWLSWLRSNGQAHRIRGIRIRCYSAAQTVLPDGAPMVLDEKLFRRADPSARRIELRFLQLQGRKTP